MQKTMFYNDVLTHVFQFLDLDQLLFCVPRVCALWYHVSRMKGVYKSANGRIKFRFCCDACYKWVNQSSSKIFDMAFRTISPPCKKARDCFESPDKKSNVLTYMQDRFASFEGTPWSFLRNVQITLRLDHQAMDQLSSSLSFLPHLDQLHLHHIFYHESYSPSCPYESNYAESTKPNSQPCPSCMEFARVLSHIRALTICEWKIWLPLYYLAQLQQKDGEETKENKTKRVLNFRYLVKRDYVHIEHKMNLFRDMMTLLSHNTIEYEFIFDEEYFTAAYWTVCLNALAQSKKADNKWKFCADVIWDEELQRLFAKARRTEHLRVLDLSCLCINHINEKSSKSLERLLKAKPDLVLNRSFLVSQPVCEKSNAQIQSAEQMDYVYINDEYNHYQ